MIDYLSVAKKLLPVAGLLILVLVGWKAANVWEERKQLRTENRSLRQQLALYRTNAERLELCLAESTRCLERVDEIEAINSAWSEEIDRLRATPPERVEVPVEVAAPGTPCSQAVSEAREWLLAHPPSPYPGEAP